jgi:hypothetical protein
MQDFNIFLSVYPKSRKNAPNKVDVRANSIVISSNLKFTLASIIEKYCYIIPREPA